MMTLTTMTDAAVPYLIIASAFLVLALTYVAGYCHGASSVYTLWAKGVARRHEKGNELLGRVGGAK
jgi:hypothetical protein